MICGCKCVYSMSLQIKLLHAYHTCLLVDHDYILMAVSKTDALKHLENVVTENICDKHSTTTEFWETHNS